MRGAGDVRPLGAGCKRPGGRVRGAGAPLQAQRSCASARLAGCKRPGGRVRGAGAPLQAQRSCASTRLGRAASGQEAASMAQGRHCKRSGAARPLGSRRALRHSALLTFDFVTRHPAAAGQALTSSDP